jgi:hypothetical protein
VCPLELRAGIVGGVCTPAMARMVTYSMGHMTSAESAALIREFGIEGPSSSTCDRIPKVVGEAWEAHPCRVGTGVARDGDGAGGGHGAGGVARRGDGARQGGAGRGEGGAREEAQGPGEGHGRPRRVSRSGLRHRDPVRPRGRGGQAPADDPLRARARRRRRRRSRSSSRRRPGRSLRCGPT